MSRTVKRTKTRNLFHNGERGHHNSLMREFHKTGSLMLKDFCGLIDKRYYDSDRNKGFRNAQNGIRRARLKRISEKTIVDQIDDRK